MKLLRHTLKHSTIAFGILFLFFALVTYPLFTPGYIPTHDGEYHILRFIEFKKVIDSGTLIPRWAPDFNNGYGVPLFNFHYPFPNYVGSVLQWIGIDAVHAFYISIALGYGVALVAAFLFFRRYFTPVVSSLYTVIFGSVPYWFVDMYVRGTVGEVWGIAWVMVAISSCAWSNWIVFTFSIFFLVISHNIMAMIFLPVLFVYLLIEKRKFLPHLLLGILAAGYFWIPAIAEQRFVDGLTIVSFRDHFATLADLLIPSWGTGFSGMGITGNQMSMQLGIIPVLVFLIALVAFLRGKKNLLSFLSLVLFSLAAFFILDLSLPIWTIVHPLSYAQYPWRFLSYIIIVTPFLLLILKERRKLAVTLAILSIIVTYSYMRPVKYPDRIAKYYLDRPEFITGTSSLGNSFATKWNPWKKEDLLPLIGVTQGYGTINNVVHKPLQDSVILTATSSAVIQFHRSYYPGWVITLNNTTYPTSPDARGLISVPVLMGENTITVRFGPTPLRMFANILSLASFLVIVILSILQIT